MRGRFTIYLSNNKPKAVLMLGTMENYHKNGIKSRFNTMGSLTKTNNLNIAKTVPKIYLRAFNSLFYENKREHINC